MYLNIFLVNCIYGFLQQPQRDVPKSTGHFLILITLDLFCVTLLVKPLFSLKYFLPAGFSSVPSPTWSSFCGSVLPLLYFVHTPWVISFSHMILHTMCKLMIHPLTFIASLGFSSE